MPTRFCGDEPSLVIELGDERRPGRWSWPFAAVEVVDQIDPAGPELRQCEIKAGEFSGHASAKMKSNCAAGKLRENSSHPSMPGCAPIAAKVAPGDGDSVGVGVD
jgi:hypothetical protein